MVDICEFVYNDTFVKLDEKIYNTLKSQLPLYLNESEIADAFAKLLTERYQKYQKFLTTYCSLLNEDIVIRKFGINKILEKNVITELLDNKPYSLLDSITKRNSIDMVYSVSDIILNGGTLHKIIVTENNPLKLVLDNYEEIDYSYIKEYVPISFLDEIKRVVPPVELPLYVAKVVYRLDNFHKVMAVVSTMLYENKHLLIPDIQGLTPVQKFIINYLIYSKKYPEMLTSKNSIDSGPLKQHILMLDSPHLEEIIHIVFKNTMSESERNILYNYITSFSDIDDLYNNFSYRDLYAQGLNSFAVFLLKDKVDNRILFSYIISQYLKDSNTSDINKTLYTFNNTHKYYWIPAFIQNPFYYAKLKNFEFYKFLLKITNFIFNEATDEEYVTIQNYATETVNRVLRNFDIPLQFQKQINLDYVYRIKKQLYKIVPLYVHIVDVIVESVIDEQITQRLSVLTESHSETIFGYYLDANLVQSLSVNSEQIRSTTYEYDFQEQLNELLSLNMNIEKTTSYWSTFSSDPLQYSPSILTQQQEATTQL